ncbi:MAG TPA: rod shape-determining protein MreD [Candidatus Acidoferrales bacterium]|nr:rod shape-determining protein MreD [Candidatus Acidoferrales bacterium]
MTIRIDTQTQNIEVHKYYAGTVIVVCFLAIVLQAFLNKFSPNFQLFELPLLVVIYFGLSRRNSVTGILLGAVVGILQDGISHTPIGLYGIAKAFIGYLASSIGARLDTEHPIARFILTFAFFHVHQVVVATTDRLLLEQSERFFSVHLLLSSVINAAIAVFLFAGLDRLRKQ